MNKTKKLMNEEIEDILALTPLQEGILYHYLKKPNSRMYHEELYLSLVGEINPSLFEAAWQHVIKSNDMLRTVFRWEGVTQPVQIILKECPTHIKYSEEQPIDNSDSFDLQFVPFSIELCRLSNKKYEMILRYHHILFDGWSNGIILQEFISTYRELEKGNQPILLSKPKFKEYILWQQKQVKSEQTSFWNDYLADLEEQENLSVNHHQGSENSTQAQTYIEELGEKRSARLRHFAQKQGVTLATLFYAAWGLLLQRYKNSDDVIFGTTVSGRLAPIQGISDMVGLLINTPPLRVLSSDTQTVSDLLKRIHNDMQRRAEFESTSLVDLDVSFDTIMVVENYPLNLENLTEANENMSINGYEISELTNYDLTFSIECFDLVRLKIIWPQNLFDQEQITRLVTHFVQLLDSISSDEKQFIHKLEMLTDEEEKELIEGVQDKQITYPYTTLHHLFETQVEKFPDKVALTFNSEQMTYLELNERADKVACALRKRGMMPESLVAIMLDYSFDMIISILGVLKAGGAYVPIDPDYPKDRIHFILKDSGSNVLITSHLTKSSLEYESEILFIEELEREEIHTLERIEVSPNNLAYVMYTSGTTGRPKGVMIEHRNVVQLIMHQPNHFHFSDRDVWLLFHSFCFDMSVWEIFGALSNGGRLVLTTKETIRDTYTLAELVAKECVTVLNQTPSAFYIFQKMVEEMPELSFAIRIITFGGEKLKPTLLQSWFKRSPNTVLVNMYGITETTVHTTYKEIGEKEINSNLSTIGVPLPTYSCYVFDKRMRLVPKGTKGELYVGGEGVARGYLSRPELNSIHFIENPYRPGERIYKSGDLVRMLENGHMIYSGRVDHQVKIRGYRIEVGEIEYLLQQHAAVKEAVVLTITDHEDMQELCAYVLTDQDLSQEELRYFLADKVPSYMIPAFIVPLKNFPLTANAKINRQALPKPDRTVGSDKAFNNFESAVADVWKEVLGLEKVGLYNNFFDVGGNSLKMIRLLSRLRSTFKKDITMPTLFRYTNVYEQARYFSDGVEENPEKQLEPKESHPPSGINKNDVAVVGMAVRMPGASNLEQFWTNLQNGTESIQVFTDEELIKMGIPQEMIQKPNYVKSKGYLDDVNYFDNQFFDYSSKEAEMMDPQLRILHECAWEAMEHAGETDNHDRKTGVYVGGSPNFHWLRSVANISSNNLDEFQAMLLNEKDFFATRLAYKLNLKGPAVTVQTACSTSLVAVHHAWSDLMEGRCDTALAGGVSITYPTKSGYLYEEGMIFSPDGHCRAFDQDAKGTVSGNGCGVVALKRLEDAIKDGNTIYATMKGAAINNDGANKAGYTTPGVDGQTAVIKAAYEKAGIVPEDISYIEAHGTGTELGDPVEVEALKLAFGSQEPGSVLIGSVKTNIGHLDAAAGVGGLIKTVLALKYKQIPPSLHYKDAHPNIDFGKNPFRVNTELIPWEEDVRRAGVSSFGMGGTNVHVVLESVPDSDSYNYTEETEWNMVTLSSKSDQALDSAAENLALHLENTPDISLSDVAYTLHNGRRDFPFRRSLVAEHTSDAIAQLRGAVGSEKVEAIERRPIIFLFSGQGSQYVNMGKELYEKEPVFRKYMDQGLEMLSEWLHDDIKAILYPTNERERIAAQQIKRTSLAQPLLFVFEYALAKLVMNWGILPRLMFGHSIGEFVASCLAEVMSYEDALNLVMIRGKLMESVSEGSMLSVNLSVEEIEPFMTDFNHLDLAVVNTPYHVVLSGPTSSISQMEKKLSAHGVKASRLFTSHAFHSHMMDEILEPFEKEVASVRLSEPKIPYLSNVTGNLITAEQVTSPAYWSQHLRSTVQFSKGLSEIFHIENAICLEIGPGNVLSTFVASHPNKNSRQQSINLLRHPFEKSPDIAHLYKQIGRLWMQGGIVDWKAFYNQKKKRLVELPTYPFVKQRFICDPSPEVQSKEEKMKSERKKKREDIAEWFYLPSWERSPLDDVQARRQQKIKYKWIVFSDNQYRSNQLVEQLKKEGHYVISVLKGNSFSKLSEDLYTVCPYKKLDYELLFTELEQKRLLPDKIIHAWSLNPVQESNLGIERVEHAIQQGYYSLLYISQSIAKCSYEGSLQIVVLTERMYDVTGTEKSLRPELAPILGFTKICNLEFTNMNCRIIDFDLDSDYSYVDAVLTECFSSANDMIVAYRGRHRWLQTMIQRRFEKVDMMKNKLREGGVYLITGGLGGIGLSIAKYLAKKVPGIKLVLLGRSEFPPRDQWDEHLTHEDERKAHVISSLLEMENYGSENMIISSDVANEAEMSKVIRDVKARFGTINGVIHAAGIADYLGVMVNRKKEANDEILAPKIKGTLVLDSLLKDEPLDFFVLCSSIGNVAYHMKFGQSGYNAANEFLDAFANYKNSLGGVYTVSINWPDWQEVGMSLESAEIWARQFNLDLNTVLNEGMSVEEGLEVFQRVVNSNHQQVIASPTDLHWKLTHEASYYNQLLERGSENRIKQDRSNLMATYSPPTNEIEQKLSELWKNMFGLEQIGIYDNFFDLGISSLDLVRVNAKLKELFNRDVPIIALYEHTSIHALSEYLSDTETNYNSTASKTKLKKSKSVMKDTLSALNRRK